MKKLLIVLSLLAVLIVGFYMIIDGLSRKSFNETHPVPDLKVSADSAMLEHGRYLVYGPAHCAHCHSPIENIAALEAGEEVDMTGGFEFAIPIGTIVTPNITPDKETGIGSLTDGQLYRMMRHNVRSDGQACIDFMPFFNMSERDIECVIAYIKSRKPLEKENKESEYNMLGKVIRSFVLKPSEPNGEPIDFIARDSSVAYGKYLSESVANCKGCHTNRDLKTGEFIGEPYAGGFQFGPDVSTNNWTFTSPNITTDPTTGMLANWNEQQFIARMRGGRVHQYSPMPWGPFSRLSEDDLKAVYRYLVTVPPVTQTVTSVAIAPES
ncbi:MAG: hypothetical protein R2813_11720 [Flavobacteriales bacterium]